MMLDRILERFEDVDFIQFDGLDAAVVGVEANTLVLIYSIPKCIEVMIENGATEEEAWMDLEHNYINAFYNERQPILIHDEY